MDSAQISTGTAAASDLLGVRAREGNFAAMLDGSERQDAIIA